MMEGASWKGEMHGQTGSSSSFMLLAYEVIMVIDFRAGGAGRAPTDHP